MAVEDDGQSADHKKTHLMVDAQFQELFEVWR
jgi:hypothetical protein